jgi:hypothetical protein
VGGIDTLRGRVRECALLDYAVAAAPEFLVTRAAGVESETELAFAALQRVCAPILDRVVRLPGPQREALEVAFGLKNGPPPAHS